MRTSLPMRAVSASAALALLLSLGLEAAFAHPQASFGPPAMRPGFVHGHALAPGSRNGAHSSWMWRGGSRGDRFSRDGGFRNRFGLVGGGFWYPPYGLADAGGGGGGSLIVIGGSTPGIYPAASIGGFEANSGGCVIHKLIYNANGKYVGERQTPEC
jgi:hypothetical protein